MIIEQLAGEVVVYDGATQNVHVLTGELLGVFRKLKDEAPLVIDRDVEECLGILREKGLLEGPSLSRRDFLEKSAYAALITTIVSPLPAAAGSGATCNCSCPEIVAGGISPSACCNIANPATACAGCGATSDSASCGTVACLEPSGTCSCRANNTFCVNVVNGTVIERCCRGTRANQASCGGIA